MKLKKDGSGITEGTEDKENFAKQTDTLLKLGLDTGTSASDLLGVHAFRRAIEDGNIQLAEDVAQLLQWDKVE